jgi:hypothetical protein
LTDFPLKLQPQREREKKENNTKRHLKNALTISEHEIIISEEKEKRVFLL